MESQTQACQNNNKLALIRLLILMVQCHPVMETLTSSLRHLNKQPLVRIPPPIDWVKLNSWHLGLLQVLLPLGAGTHLLLVLG